MHGVIAGGDYKRPNDDGPNLAFTEDGGKTWKLSSVHPLAYFSAVAYDRKVNAQAIQEALVEKRMRVRGAAPQRIFIIGQDFMLDFRPPRDPRRINVKKKLGIQFNAASALGTGGRSPDRRPKRGNRVDSVTG